MKSIISLIDQPTTITLEDLIKVRDLIKDMPRQDFFFLIVPDTMTQTIDELENIANNDPQVVAQAGGRKIKVFKAERIES